MACFCFVLCVSWSGLGVVLVFFVFGLFASQSVCVSFFGVSLHVCRFAENTIKIVVSAKKQKHDKISKLKAGPIQS